MASPSTAPDSLAVLADVWRSGRSGTFVLQSSRSRIDVAVSRGGLVDLAHLSDLRWAAGVGRVSFQVAEPRPGVVGNRAALGGLVLEMTQVRDSIRSQLLPSDALVRLSVDGNLLRGLVSDQLVDRLERRPVVVEALLRDGSSTVAELRALERLDCLYIELASDRAAAPAAASAEVDAGRPVIDLSTAQGFHPDDQEDLLELSSEDLDSTVDRSEWSEAMASLAPPSLAPPPVLGLVADDDELLAMHADDEDELVEAAEADESDPFPLPTLEDDGAGDDLLALAEADEHDEHPETVLSFDAAPGLDAFAEAVATDDDLLGMPDAEDEVLEQDAAGVQAVLEWDEAPASAWTGVADIEDRVAEHVQRGPRQVAEQRPDRLDVVPFGQEQDEVAPMGADGAAADDTAAGDEVDVYGDEDESVFDARLAGLFSEPEDVVVGEAAMAETPDDPFALPPELAAVDETTWDGDDSLESFDDLDTVDDLFRRAELLEGFGDDDEATASPWGPDDEPSLVLAQPPAKAEADTAAVRPAAAARRAEPETERIVPEPVLDDGETELPEALSCELSGVKLRVRDELTAEIALELLKRARTELALGLVDDARNTLERAEMLVPGDPTVEVHLAWTELLAGRHEGAARRAHHAVCEAPYDNVVMGLAAALADHVGTTVRG